MKLGEAMYAAQQGSADGADGAEAADDGVVDAEFEEVDDNKPAA
jgi:molecular chaperone DnaK